jgi:uncharacterized protein YbjT (DUF2867 family)
MSKILVIGASGTVGKPLVELLRGKGHQVVRATSHEPGTDQVKLDLVTGEGIAAAFAGVERAFVLAPPGHTNQDVLLQPVFAEAKARGLKKLVLMTAMGANADSASPFRKAEVALEQSGIPYNIIRPNWFMQNFNSYWLHGIQTQGKILLPVGKAKGSFIDARDIAAVAAELVTRSDFDGRDFDLTGGEALDHDQVAVHLSRETASRIEFQDITNEAMLAGLLAAQLPKTYAEFMVVILGYFKLGYSERITDAVETITGRPPIRFAQYAQDYRTAWLRSA